jgi:hypothetical protein
MQVVVKTVHVDSSQNIRDVIDQVQRDLARSLFEGCCRRFKINKLFFMSLKGRNRVGMQCISSFGGVAISKM